MGKPRKNGDVKRNSEDLWKQDISNLNNFEEVNILKVKILNIKIYIIKVKILNLVLVSSSGLYIKNSN